MDYYKMAVLELVIGGILGLRWLILWLLI